MRPPRIAPLAALAALALALPTAQAASAQSVRVSGATRIRYVEVRPLVRDSVAADETEGTGLLRQLADGRIVRCVPGEAFCRNTRPGDAVSAVPIVHDLEASAWGFGQGLRLFTQLRGRDVLGGSPDLWPNADDAFDVLAAYAELERERFRVRAGRQWKVSGLGLYNFDGLALALRPTPAVWLEAYAGRSLIRGLNEPRAGGALEAVEALAPPAPGLLTGVQARYRPTPRLALSATYQVDFRRDGGGIYSELAVADGAVRIGAGSVEGSVEMDMAAGSVNEARLRARSPVIGWTALFAEVRRHRPYFELWTIWGAFSPVGFDEARGGVTVAEPHGGVVVRGEAWYRRYEDAGASEGVGAFRDDGWGLGSSVSWSPAQRWRLDGGYRVETGFGAARRDGYVGLARQLGERVSFAVQGLAFQRLYEFRLDEGTVLGLGGEASVRLSSSTRLSGGAMVYRHLGAAGAAGPDWSQRRGSVLLQWTVGPAPESPARAGGAP